MSKTKLGQVVFPPKEYELIETINIEADVSMQFDSDERSDTYAQNQH